MALWDAAELLARCKRMAGVPTTTEFPADADWYAWLTEAQAHWYNVFAAQAPWVLMGAPQTLTTADSGATYTFPSSVTPLAVEVYDSQYDLMKNGAFWDRSADYVWEGNKIRFPRAVSKPSTYYARYVSPPGAIDAVPTEPTLVPSHTRLLLVYRATALWATRGGMRDPTPFYEAERRFWLGDMSIGDVGVLGALKMQNPFLGSAAYTSGVGNPWEYDTGAGYVKYTP